MFIGKGIIIEGEIDRVTDITFDPLNGEDGIPAYLKIRDEIIDGLTTVDLRLMAAEDLGTNAAQVMSLNELLSWYQTPRNQFSCK